MSQILKRLDAVCNFCARFAKFLLLLAISSMPADCSSVAADTVSASAATAFAERSTSVVDVTIYCMLSCNSCIVLDIDSAP